MSKQAQAVSFDQQISDQINVTPGMKLSVVWRQLDGALVKVSADISSYNGALAKTLPMLKKQEMAKFLNATRDGKYIKFPDGSQARY